MSAKTCVRVVDKLLHLRQVLEGKHNDADQQGQVGNALHGACMGVR